MTHSLRTPVLWNKVASHLVLSPCIGKISWGMCMDIDVCVNLQIEMMINFMYHLSEMIELAAFQ